MVKLEALFQPLLNLCSLENVSCELILFDFLHRLVYLRCSILICIFHMDFWVDVALEYSTSDFKIYSMNWDHMFFYKDTNAIFILFYFSEMWEDIILCLLPIGGIF